MTRPVSIAQVHRWHREGRRFSMVTAYDHSAARLVEQAGVPLILVGDSLGMVVAGEDSTVPVTVEQMAYHCRMVARGAPTPLVVGDLPFLSYGTVEDAVASSRAVMQAGAQSVKLEGGRALAPVVRRLVELGVPVMGHLGFTPQSVHSIGLAVQGKGEDGARRLLDDALALQGAGAWAIVLELVPGDLAEAVTARLDIPTIGIGAGVGCSGQVQVWHDVLGLVTDFVPRHARQFRTLGAEAVAALGEYDQQVQAGSFPTDDHTAAYRFDGDLAAVLDGCTDAGEVG